MNYSALVCTPIIKILDPPLAAPWLRSFPPPPASSAPATLSPASSEDDLHLLASYDGLQICNPMLQENKGWPRCALRRVRRAQVRWRTSGPWPSADMALVMLMMGVPRA